MKRYDIKFRSFSVTERMIRINLTNFFTKQSFLKSNYLLTNIKAVINNNTYLISKNVFVNRKDREEIKTLITNVVEFLSSKDLSPSYEDKIIIFYIEVNEPDYKNYKTTLKNIGKRFNSTFSKLGRRLYSSKSNQQITQLRLNRWYDYSYYLSGKVLLAEHIEYAIRDFWVNIVDHLEVNQYILIQFKLKTIDEEYRSISYVQTVNKTDLEKLINIFKEYWSLRNDAYHQYSIDSIVFTYKVLVKKGSIGESKITNHKKVLVNNAKIFKFEGYNLPSTMDISSWSGNVQFNEDYTSAIVYINNSPREYHVQLFDNYQKVQVVLDKVVILDFTDYVDNVYDLSTFTRAIKSHKYFFVNGELIVKQLERKVKFLTKIDKESELTNKFITMDLETRNINGILEPYCIASYCVDSNNIERVMSFYLNDYSSSEAMLKAAVLNLLTSTYNGYIIYLHNFSNFDGVFLIRILSEISTKVKPIIRDGRIINISVKYGNKNNYTINFRDSYLMLTGSLSNLAKDFKINLNKGIFPYRFVDNNNIKLNYKGKFPEISYFDGISIEEYNEYCNSKYLFDLEYETRNYCELDCKVLYLIISKFSALIFELFSINISNYPTLPSITMGIFRSNFLKDDYKIPLIDGNTYNTLKKAYTGGMVDVYKPYNDPGTEVFSYDVNSLYPFSMDNFPMPVGTPIFFEGDIFKINPSAFGVFEVEVETPQDLKFPLLQVKIKTDSGNRTITPLGNWTSWYFSEDIYNAIDFGYKFKVIRGYLFKKGYIFKDFVNQIYKIKANSKKGTPLYLMSKLILNSLYGKFGTNPDFENHLIISSDKSQEYNHKYIITNVINLGNNKELITYYNNKSNKENNKLSIDVTSIPIALAITAYSRIHMSYIKKIALLLGLIIYYMDTDSIALSGKLPVDFIGTELGKLKLEHVFNEVIYLAPKVYGGKNDSYEYTKVKGLKNHILFKELKPLLIKNNSLILNQDKWYKHIGQGNIHIKNEIYTLMLTENKRQIIFNENNMFVDTKPYILSNGKIINER